MSDTTIPKLSSRWILDFEKQIQRRKHIVLYGNVHDQFLWRGDYLTAEEFLLAYFRGMAFDIVVRFDPIDGFQFAEERDQPPRKVNDKPLPPTMRGRFDELLRRGVVERNIGLPGTNSPTPNAQEREEGRGKKPYPQHLTPNTQRLPIPARPPRARVRRRSNHSARGALRRKPPLAICAFLWDRTPLRSSPSPISATC